jgi:hypothetical protein
VKRGGSWNNNAQNCRSANRNNNNPNNRNNNNGFRLTSSRRRSDATDSGIRRRIIAMTIAPDLFRIDPDEKGQSAAAGRPKGSNAAAGVFNVRTRIVETDRSLCGLCVLCG